MRVSDRGPLSPPIRFHRNPNYNTIHHPNLLRLETWAPANKWKCKNKSDSCESENRAELGKEVPPNSIPISQALLNFSLLTQLLSTAQFTMYNWALVRSGRQKSP
jgi:hypothetical protein